MTRAAASAGALPLASIGDEISGIREVAGIHIPKGVGA